MEQSLQNWIQQIVKTQEAAYVLSKTALFIIAVLTGFAVKWLSRRLFHEAIRKAAQRSRNTFDDILVDSGILQRFYQIIPLIIVYFSVHIIFDKPNMATSILERMLMSAIIVVVILALNNAVDAVDVYYRKLEISKKTPIRSYLQLLKIFLVLTAVIFVIATLMDKSPWWLMSSIGAMTAIVLLIFKDWLLGFVASIQINSNDLVNIGDWIQMPKYNADGDVIDINLNTVQVQNFDKTITSIPTYALISESFINWRGMREAGGRRIKRVIYIDVNSVRFCDRDMLARFKKIRYLGEYISGKEKEIASYNKKLGIARSDMINGRHLTNLGTFRIYVTEYLKHHERIRQDMTLMVRHKDPGEYGIPVEIYAFTADTDWVKYEEIQANIFDHIIAVAPSFGLSLYQNPSGSDVRRVMENLKNPGNKKNQ
ncbi:MAG: mechanosensitive ion channel protein MscS [Spirochaetae bacterium HGW-Spirochaetae-1]|jgi:miniconductance mechanosensitive channel|nr:MAG: mechanosensitive ion channel protein MscS [Spirochaetae bacterium HGW-Spirochaetae-1]